MPPLPAHTRAHRLPAWLRLRFADSAILLVALGIAGVGASSLVEIQRSGDEARQAEVLVSRMAASTGTLEHLLLEASERPGDRAAVRAIRHEEARLEGTYRELVALEQDRTRLAALRRDYSDLRLGVDAVLGGQVGSLSSVEPSQRHLSALAAHYEREASAKMRATTLGSTAAVLAAALLVALLAIGFGRRRAARERAALEARTALVRLLEAVSAASNAAATQDDALLAALDEICAHTGWPLGHAYLLSEDGTGELAASGLWHAEGHAAGYEPFRVETERRRFAAGEGLPGRALAERRPVWITDVIAPDSGMPRATVAHDVGIRSAFAFPVFVRDEVVAVLEFFSLEAHPPDEPFLEATAHVGFQLGYLIERKRAESELRAAEETYRVLVEELPLATYVDALDDTSSAIYMSPQIEAMLGYTPDEWLADKELFPKLLHPDDRERVLAEVARTNAAEEPFRCEYRLIARDGRVVWIRDEDVIVRDGEGRALHSQGYLLDITERKGTEERLRETEERYRTLVEQLPLVVYIDEPDREREHFWRITYVSPQIETMLAYTPDEWLTMSFADVIHPDDREWVREEHVRTYRDLSELDLEYRLLHRDGRTVWVRDRMVFVGGAGGNAPRTQGYLLDITARKTVEEALELSLERERAANEHLRELDRLKDEFIALVSHELRTPLTSIRGYLEFLLEEADLFEPDQARFLGIIERNAERLQHLVNDLLFVAQVDAGRLTIEQQDVDLAALAAEAVETARVFAEAKRIELVLVADPAVRLTGDRARLGQLLDNFISNAIKFTPDRGRVEVRTWAADGRALISVTDSGIGIPEDERERLFERFYRASSATEQAIPGTGLGLAIVKAIVDAHDGAISVESTVGAGTTFTVELPLAVDAARRAA